MMVKLRLAVKKNDVSYLRASVAYNRDKRAVYLAVVPIEDAPDGVVRFVMTRMEFLLLETMGRKSAKRLAMIETETRLELGSASGRSWEFASMVAAKHGLELDRDDPLLPAA